MNKVFKTKNEYCHIFNDKLVITTSPESFDLIADYSKTINNMFKTLMVFFIFIPIFASLSAVFYNIDKIGLAVYSCIYDYLFI